MLKSRIKFRLAKLASLICFSFIAILAFGSTQRLESKSNFCEITHPQKSKVALTHHPLFDTPYKMAANYSPVLVLRALGETEFYRAKGSAHMLRKFYVKDLTGELAEPYEVMDIDIKAKARGFFGRTIEASGKIDGHNFYYQNKMSLGLPKKVDMNILVSLAGCEMMKLKVKTEGSAKTNKVTGTFLGKTVDYFTDWRDSKGILSGTAYEIYVNGLADGDLYHGISNGDIAGFKIKGDARETSHNHFEIVEEYGYILVKTILDVEDGTTK